MRSLLLHLPGPGGGLLSPWGAVLLHLHLFLRTSTVVESSCQGHADGLLLVPKHRAQPGGGSGGGGAGGRGVGGGEEGKRGKGRSYVVRGCWGSLSGSAARYGRRLSGLLHAGFPRPLRPRKKRREEGARRSRRGSRMRGRKRSCSRNAVLSVIRNRSTHVPLIQGSDPASGSRADSC